ncbi:MAG: GDP-mannose 4,6-dehydratase [Limisphaerales bacterium]
MKYLITGGAGFVGSHLTEYLLNDGHQVTILDDFSTGGYRNLAHLEDHQDLKILTGDVRDAALTKESVHEADMVYHLASAVGVQLVVDRPVHTIDTIVHGTATVLDACRTYRRPVLITSTSEVYGKNANVPFNEEDDSVTGPPSKHRWCYAGAKALDEFLGMAHWHECHLPVVLVRLFNTVGPRQTGQYGMVIPNFINRALRHETIRVFGDGKQSRCFGHVNDIVWALAHLLGPTETRGELYNVGTSEEISIMGLAQKIKEMTNSDSEIVTVPYEQAYGVGFEDMDRRMPDITKINQAIGYEPKNKLDDIIRDCVEYAKSQL